MTEETAKRIAESLEEISVTLDRLVHQMEIRYG